MALLTALLDSKGVLAVMATTAGVPRLQSSHSEMFDPCFVGKPSGVAIRAFVHSQMEFVAELDFPSICLEGDVRRLEPFVTTVAIAGNGECVLVVMAEPACFSLSHYGHGELVRSCLVGKDLGMTILA